MLGGLILIYIGGALPIVANFFILQKQLISGLSSGAVKG
jgi:ABC-type maltose transport system permease subunit